MARLKPGVTISAADEEMRALAKRLREQYPDDDRDIGAVVTPMKEDVLGRMQTVLVALMCAAGFVLLIACANLASLLLTRAVARKREIAIRAALGAGRRRLIRQMVTEGALLSFAGGALGWGFALAGMKALSGLVPLGLPSTAKPGIDARLMLFTFALSLATGVIFSLIPALEASRASVNDALKQGGRSGADSRGRRTRDALVVLQVASALVLLTGAGLMIETMAKLRVIDLGFRPDHLLTLRTPQGSLYDDSVKALEFSAARALSGGRKQRDPYGISPSDCGNGKENYSPMAARRSISRWAAIDGTGTRHACWNGSAKKAGTIEALHDELKNDSAAGVKPCGRFGAYAAWLRLAASV